MTLALLLLVQLAWLGMPATREGVEDDPACVARALLAEAEAARANRKLDVARDLVGAALDALGGPSVEEPNDPSLEELLSHIGDVAMGLNAFAVSAEARSRRYELLLAYGDRADFVLEEARAKLAIAKDLAGENDEARSLFALVLAIYEESLPGDHPRVLRARRHLATCVAKSGDPGRARELLEANVAAGGDAPTADDVEIVRSHVALAKIQLRLGDLGAALLQSTRTVEMCESILDPEHPYLRDVLTTLALVHVRRREHAAARPLYEKTLRSFEAAGMRGSAAELEVRLALGQTLWHLGEKAEGRRRVKEVVRELAVIRPKDHPDIQRVKVTLAFLVKEDGDLEEARALESEALRKLETALPPGHSTLNSVRMNLAVTLGRLGHARQSRDLHARVLSAVESSGSPDFLVLQQSRVNYAGALRETGELHRARDLLEGVLRAFESRVPDDHGDLQAARGQLALTCEALGDLERARVLAEKVVAIESSRPEQYGYPSSLTTLAGIVEDTGDSAGARVLYERAAAWFAERVPEGHPSRIRTRLNVARTSLDRRPWEEALTALTGVVPDESPLLVGARLGLAGRLYFEEELDESIAQYERAVRALESGSDEAEPLLRYGRKNFAQALLQNGEVDRARHQLEVMIAASEEFLPRNDAELRTARAWLALIRLVNGDEPVARDLLATTMLATNDWLVSGLALSGRHAAERAMAESTVTNIALGIADVLGGAALEDAFCLVETRRHAATSASGYVDDALAPLRASAAAASHRLSNVVLAGARKGEDASEYRTRVHELALERDEADRSLRGALLDRGEFVGEIRLGEVARGLSPGSAAVGFVRHAPLSRYRDGRSSGPERIRAFVVRADGSLESIDLGPAREIIRAIERWKPGFRAPSVRGVPFATAKSSEVTGGSEELRRLVLDPILEAVGDARRLHVCLDDALHVVPLEAFPLGDGYVGDRCRVVREVSFARLLRAPQPPPRGAPSMLVVGSPDFDAVGDDARVGGALSAPRLDDREHDVDGSPFTPLPETRIEAAEVARLFSDTFDEEALVLLDDAATKARFFAECRGARFVHLATHGWFLPDGVPSWGDSGDKMGGVGDIIRGFAPSTLCGLAFAGARRPPDGAGRVPGLVTAEEIANVDLTDCSVCVLSACETNVGLRRAGLGMRSLQAAVHSAGARSTVTSLWKVDDRATRRLMVLLYEAMWRDGHPVADALWEAKTTLRREGAPLHHWAGFVFSGDPTAH